MGPETIRKLEYHTRVFLKGQSEETLPKKLKQNEL